ncbi:penicillin-binding protein 2 [Desulfovibrio aerotolerans]|uniref:Penicillin-binding protein 2 n=1 Tax=Solidesulfovibrio aerotolerans TaxID=295255 RepID=A0A7C9IJQ1_9BACT|nr:penicillin-binding protein 2 [Solidesulfovibrio aerotolerans]MYL82385.1 penicillin-binding protein 2 [Solidesulfovibrio aerotolerans]
MRLESDSPQQHAPRSGLILLQALVLGLFCLFTLRLWYLQVHKGSKFSEMSRDNQLRQVLIGSARGRIVDANGLPLALSEPSFALGLVREDCEDVDATLTKVSEWTGVDKHVLTETFKRGKKRVKPFEPLILSTDLPFEALARIEANAMLYPGLEIVIRQKRYYPTGELMSHVLGYVAEANEDELEKNPQLSLGDSVGKQGLELTLENELRGSKGRKQVEVDAFGRQHNEAILEPPQAGKDIKLSIDANLQRESAKLLEGQAGAIVVMEPDTGKLLAMVSQPSFDNNMFVLGVPADKWRELRDNPRHPIQNRVTQGVYPPGSVFKLLMAAAGLSEGLIRPGDVVACPGTYRVGNRDFHDWKKGGHGALDLRGALVHSCDIYFYKLGDRMGIDRLHDYATASGFGARTGIDLPHEKAGLIPSKEWKRKRFGAAWSKGETVIASIGQGYVLTSPLQIARYLSALVNGGRLMKPELVQTEAPRLDATLPVKDTDRQIILDAMVTTVEQGTGKSLLRSDVVTGAKTGTAQVVKLINADVRQKTAQMPYEQRDHAWVASWGRKDGKTYVVVCLVEHGGHGGEVSGPIVRKIFEQLFGSAPARSAKSAAAAPAPTPATDPADVGD